jgi:lactate permease
VTFGSLGSSFFALMAATGRPGEELAPWCAVMLGLSCLGCGAGTLWAAGGWPTLRRGLVPLFLIWLTMAGVQALAVTQGLWSVGAMLGGLAGLAVGVVWARWRSGRRNSAPASEGLVRGIPLGWALLPYALLVAIVLIALIPPLETVLGQAVIRAEFPELTTARGWTTPAGQGRTVNLFGHAGALLTYASLVTYGLFRWRGYYRPGALGRILRGAAGRMRRSGLGTMAMVGMAVTMEHAGMTHLLAAGIARVAGRAFPAVSPFVGVLGAFMTGSNTNSNVVFGDLQQSVATLIGVSPLIILAAQTAGGAIGSAFAPAKIIVGCSTVDAEEGPVLKAVMRYGLAIVASVAVATAAAIYVF